MNYIIFDLEATCWRGKPPHGVNEIIEIGAFKLNEFGEMVGEFNKFIKPTVNPQLSYFCIKLTSITQDQVHKAKTYPIVLEAFQNWINLDQDYVMCSWGKLDKLMFQNDCKLHNLDDAWIDQFANLKNQYKRLKKLDNPTGLKSTLKREGFDFEGKHHRAVADAYNLSKIFVKYLDDWEY